MDVELPVTAFLSCGNVGGTKGRVVLVEAKGGISSDSSETSGMPIVKCDYFEGGAVPRSNKTLVDGRFCR